MTGTYAEFKIRGNLSKKLDYGKVMKLELSQELKKRDGTAYLVTHRVVCFADTQTVARQLEEGDIVTITGSIKYGSYESRKLLDIEGNPGKIYTTDFIADEITSPRLFAGNEQGIKVDGAIDLETDLIPF